MRAISFYNSNINPDIIRYQKRVFDHYGIELEQVLHDKSHGEAIDDYLRDNEWEEIAIFDIDCIPINSFTIKHAQAQVKDNIFGAAQKANHIDGSKIYASPAFICFSKEIFMKLGFPTFKDGNGFDVGAFVSHVARQTGINVSLLWPTNVEVEKWSLEGTTMFGLGTTYQGLVYHAFESRFNETTSRFVNKCKEVIGE